MPDGIGPRGTTADVLRGRTRDVATRDEGGCVVNGVRVTVGVLIALLLAAPAAAADSESLFSVGVGWFDEGAIDPGVGFFDASDDREEAVDFRLEYRFGTSLIPAIEPYAAVRPWIGGEATSDGALYGVGGILVDVPLGPFVFTPSFGAGLYSNGSGKDLGSPVEFRTQLEFGYEFENKSRFSVSYSHISNAGISDTNPGANMLSAYYHLPASWLFGSLD